MRFFGYSAATKNNNNIIIVNKMRAVSVFVLFALLEIKQATSIEPLPTGWTLGETDELSCDAVCGDAANCFPNPVITTTAEAQTVAQIVGLSGATAMGSGATLPAVRVSDNVLVFDSMMPEARACDVAFGITPQTEFQLLCCCADVALCLLETDPPTSAPTSVPTKAPTQSPTKSAAPSASPTASPSASPTASPSASPTAAPSASPTQAPMQGKKAKSGLPANIPAGKKGGGSTPVPNAANGITPTPRTSTKAGKSGGKRRRTLFAN